MARPRKYLTGPRITTMQEFADEIAAGHYVIEWWHGTPGQNEGARVHPGWAASWRFSMVQAYLSAGRLYRAIPNPNHPHHRKETADV